MMLWSSASLASEIEPFDTMEKAFFTLGRDIFTEQPHQGWQLVHKYPFASEFPALTHVWQSADHDHYVVAAKGAPEAIATLCGLTASARATLLGKVATMAERGLRVLGVARAELPSTSGGSTPRQSYSAAALASARRGCVRKFCQGWKGSGYHSTPTPTMPPSEGKRVSVTATVRSRCG